MSYVLVVKQEEDCCEKYETEMVSPVVEKAAPKVKKAASKVKKAPSPPLEEAKRGPQEEKKNIPEIDYEAIAFSWEFFAILFVVGTLFLGVMPLSFICFIETDIRHRTEKCNYETENWSKTCAPATESYYIINGAPISAEFVSTHRHLSNLDVFVNKTYNSSYYVRDLSGYVISEGKEIHFIYNGTYDATSWLENSKNYFSCCFSDDSEKGYNICPSCKGFVNNRTIIRKRKLTNAYNVLTYFLIFWVFTRILRFYISLVNPV